MGKQKLRSEINNEYKWDLKVIYASDELWHEDFKKVTKEIQKIEKFKGIITSSAKGLLEYLETFYNLDRKLLKLYYYAHLNFDADTTDVNYQEMQGKIEKLFNQFEELDSFANPEMMLVDYDLIKSYYEKEPKLKEYEYSLENLYRFKEHILSKECEHLLSTLSLALNNASETYKFLTDTDMKFGNIIDEDGQEVELTESNYPNFLHSTNQDVRKQSFTRLLEIYSNNKNTITSTFGGNIKKLTSMAKLKNYPSSIEASLFADKIDVKVYTNLVDTVNENLNTIYKYFDLKKEVLKLDELHIYDIYLEMIKDLDKSYSFEEGKELVLNALKPLGENYINDLKQAFDQKWIDVYNNTGKRGGAYSSGFYDTYPYILLNYEGKLKDVSTLAHELGHSMHTYYSCQNNLYHNSHYKIFVAEVASTVNELLVNHYLLENSTDEREKMYVLNSMMELFKGTIYRQTMFAEFEKLTHEKYESGSVLTHELLSNEYYELNKKYFGSNVVIDDLIRYEWERIPHFYYDFYVYKYAIGLSCACYIVDGILNKKENALEDYLDFLKLGGSDYPANELKIAGIDVTDKKIIKSAIKMFDDTIEQFKEKFDKIKK